MPNAATPHLLVDGSNLLHAWPETRALLRRNKEAAKTLLLRRIAVLHDHNGWRITVVFDGRGSDLSVETVGGSPDFACVHTPVGATADDIIERLVSRAPSPSACLVATADQCERAAVEAAGAAWCDPAALLARIESATTHSGRAIARTNAAADRAWREGGHR